MKIFDKLAGMAGNTAFLVVLAAALSGCFDFGGLTRNNASECPPNQAAGSDKPACNPPPQLACTEANFMKVCYGDASSLMCEEGRCVSTRLCETNANCASGLVCVGYTKDIKWGLCTSMTSTDPKICQTSGDCAEGVECNDNPQCQTKICTAGHCAPAPDPNACKMNATCPLGNACDGSGQCQGNLLCDTTKKQCVVPLAATCGSNSDCPSGAFCTGEGTGKTCKNPNGQSCTGGNQCISNICKTGKCVGNYGDACSSPDACNSGICTAGKCDLPTCTVGGQLDNGPACGGDRSNTICKALPLCGVNRVVSKKSDCNPAVAPNYGGASDTTRGVCAGTKNTIAFKVTAPGSAAKAIVGASTNRDITDLMVGKWQVIDDDGLRAVIFVNGGGTTVTNVDGEAVIYTTTVGYPADGRDIKKFCSFGGSFGASAEMSCP